MQTPTARPTSSAFTWTLVVVGGVASAYAWAVLATTFTHPGLIGPNYNAPGADWMSIVGAARAVSVGRGGLIFDAAPFIRFLNAEYAHWLTRPLEYGPFVYPPSFLLVLLPFAQLPYLASYFAFQIAGAGLLAFALFARDDSASRAGNVWWLAVLGPAGAINVTLGQCAFLVAALLIGALRISRRRPLIAGALLGLLSFKPHLLILLPVALIASRQWRVIASAAATGAVLFLATGLAFGFGVWPAWLGLTIRNLTGGSENWSRMGHAWDDSVSTCVSLLGAPSAVATLSQVLAIGVGALACWIAFRSERPTRAQIPVFLASALLAAPHFTGADQVLLSAAGGLWILDRSRRPTPKRLLLAFVIGLAPLVGPPLLVGAGRLLPLLIAGFIYVLLKDMGALASGPPLVPAGAGAPADRAS